MAATSQDRVIVIDDYLDASTVDIVDINPTIGIVPKTVTVDEVYARLEKAHPHLRVYRREQTPAALALSRQSAHSADRRRGGRWVGGAASEAGTAAAGGQVGRRARLRPARDQHARPVRRGRSRVPPRRDRAAVRKRPHLQRARRRPRREPARRTMAMSSSPTHLSWIASPMPRPLPAAAEPVARDAVA